MDRISTLLLGRVNNSKPVLPLHWDNHHKPYPSRGQQVTKKNRLPTNQRGDAVHAAETTIGCTHTGTPGYAKKVR